MWGCFKENKSICKKLTQRGSLAGNMHLKQVNWCLYWVGFSAELPRKQGVQDGCRKCWRQSSLRSLWRSHYCVERSFWLWEGIRDGHFPSNKRTRLKSYWYTSGMHFCMGVQELQPQTLLMKKIPASQCCWTSKAFMKFVWSTKRNIYLKYCIIHSLTIGKAWV